MADYGRAILGTYSAACETLRAKLTAVADPIEGDIIFFTGTRHSGANHIGIITRVSGDTIYTVEGNTSGGSQVIDNGGSVASKSYSRSNSRILSYGRPNYSASFPATRVISVATGEIGYLEKATNANLGSKTLNAGSNNYTKYGEWIGVNGNYWCASFVSWCFHAAYDENYVAYLDTATGGVISSDGSIIPQGILALDGIPTSGNTFSVMNQTTANSSLVNYVNRLVSVATNARTLNVTRITVHIAKTVGDIYDLATLLNSTNKAYNYGIDNSGTIGLFVDENRWTNSSDNKANDQRAVNIICMNETLAPSYTLSAQCEASLLNLLEDICRRRFIFKLVHTGLDGDTLTLHVQFNPTSGCPGPYLTSRIDAIMAEVNDRIGMQRTGPNMVTVKSSLAATQTDALRVQSTVAIKSIKPYVIVPKPNQTGINYEAVRQLGVVAVMLNAGERFNSKHETVPYRVDKIYEQTQEVLAARLPHSYYYTTHARTVEELREEAYWFHFVVTKYPPRLGVWLRCAFDVGSDLAQELVEEWYLFFVDWGLKSKCGLYCTQSQAKKIGWPKQCSYMPLWLEGELTDSVCPDEVLLTPTFFKLNDLSNYGTAATNLLPLYSAGEARYQGVPAETTAAINVDTSTYKRLDGATYTDVYIPSSPYYTGTKKYESYTAITNTATNNYKITHSVKTTTDENGFRKVDGRYLIAVGSGVCFTIGTYLDVYLENGSIIQCIMGDAKADVHTDSATHIFTAVNKNYCCTEFIVETGKLVKIAKEMGDCSYAFSNWQSPVKFIRVYSQNWFS